MTAIRGLSTGNSIPHFIRFNTQKDPVDKQCKDKCGRNQVRPYTTVDMMDKLGTFAGQQHQDLSPKYREKSLTRVGIEPTTSGLDHRCSTD